MRRPSCSKSAKFAIFPVVVLYLTLYQLHDSQPSVVEHRSPYCNCSKTIRRTQVLNEPDAIEYCSQSSSARGHQQRVVAYSLYGSAYSGARLSRYFSLLSTLPRQVKHYYPDWTIRVYHSISPSQKREHHLLCHMYCHNSHVDLCDVRRLSDRWKSPSSSVSTFDLVKLNPRKWRYLALMDPLVDAFMARDVDSEINAREQAAVDQWLQSNRTFHVMRDHQFHSYAIMAGMFGVKVDQRRDLVQGLTRALITLGAGRHLFLDQILLAKVFWPTVKDDAVIHDSYFCEENWGGLPSRPFPTRRVGGSFVSDRTASDWDRPKPCPPACRPPGRADWQFC